MNLAETAHVAVQMDLTGNYAAAIKSAEAETRAFAASAGGIAAGGVSKLEQGFGKLGGALGHAKSQIGGLLTGPLGILGLGAGIFTLGGIIEGSLAKTSQFGLSLERLTALTGESSQSMGELALVASKFGIDFDRLSQIVGFTEKTLGKLENTSAHVAAGHLTVAKATEAATKAHEKLSIATLKLNTDEAKKHVSALTLTTDQIHIADATRALTKAEQDLDNARANQGVQGLNKLQALQKQYGVVLTDSKGQALDFSTVLNHVADYYTSNATAANKAALAATVFGRGYAALIPLLGLGSAGIQRSKQAIDDLGLSLGTDSQGAITAYKNALRNLGEAVDVLQISIGLALAPAISDLANSVSLFLEHGGAKQITQFFKDGAKAAQDFGHFIMTSVIPPLKSFADVAIGAWNAIPDDFKKLLLGGFVANKAIKWTFGIDVIGGAKDLLGKALGQGVKDGLVAAGLGKLFVQPVFVTNPGFGNLAGAAGGAEGAIGGAEGAGAAGGLGITGLAALAAVAAVPLIPLVAAYFLGGGEQGILQKDLAGRQATAAARGLNPANVPNMPGAHPNVFANWQAQRNAISNNLDKESRDAMASASALQDIKDSSQGMAAYAAAIAGNTAGILIEQRAAHQKAKAAVGGSGKDFHDFLMAFRSGSATVAIKDFSKELAYLSTASDSTKRGTTFIQGVKENIKALEKAEVGATGAQKLVLSADIKKLQALISGQKSQQHTDAAQIKSESARARAAMVAALRNPPSVTVNVSTKVTTDSITRSTSVSRRYGPAVAS